MLLVVLTFLKIYSMQNSETQQFYIPEAMESRRFAHNTEDPRLQIISYSLYGSNQRYLNGVIANSKLAKDIYPNWIMRVYYDKSVPVDIIKKLHDANVQLINMTSSVLRSKNVWRLLVANDTAVKRYIIRNVDARLSLRERAAVDEWVASKKRFHIMRDHPSQSRYAMLGGMWGGTHEAVPDMAARLCKWQIIKHDSEVKELEFLNKELWELANTSVLQHDSYSCKRYGGRPFPKARNGLEYVGKVVIDNTKQQKEAGEQMAKEKIREQEMTKQQECTRKKYAVFGITLPNVGDRDENLWQYVFYIPYMVHAWWRLGISCIIIITGESISDDSWNQDPKLKLIYNVSRTVPNLRFVYLESKSYNKERRVLIAQVARIFASSLVEELAENDLLITTDADLFPLYIEQYTDPDADDLFVLNANCCGNFTHREKPYNMVAMSHVTATVETWSDLSYRNKIKSSDDIISFIKIFYDIPKHIWKGENVGWYMDQYLLSILIAKSSFKQKRVTRTPAERIDRIHEKDWRFEEIGKHKIDAHMPLPGWKSPDKVKKLTHEVFQDRELIYKLDKYIDDFKSSISGAGCTIFTNPYVETLFIQGILLFLQKIFTDMSIRQTLLCLG